MTAKPPSISVVIPAYNASRFLAETLESALAQTLPPDDVVVVDDGSTDDTAAIAERFAPRVRVFRRTNHGLPASRNFGVEMTTSEWIAFLDADDLWEPNKLERQLEELTRTGADVCYTGHVLLMQQGETTRLGAVIDVPAAEDVRKTLFEHGPFMPSGVIVRRTALEAVNGFDAAMRHGNEDYDLWLRMIHAGTKFAACREPLLLYRRHEGNWSHDMAWLGWCLKTYRRRVLPHLPIFTRWIAFNRVRSACECDVAFAMRHEGDRRCLSMMVRSIWHRPFGYNLRYKVLAHMLYMRLKTTFRTSSADAVK